MKNAVKSARRANKLSTVMGLICFFVLVAVIVTVALLVYSVVAENSGGNRQTISVTMFFVIAALSALCTAFDFARRKLTTDRAVKRILDATESVANGNFNVKLVPRHSYRYYDEYDLIMENLNKMTAELSKSEVLKTDFISNVSHELKTPLAVIQNYASLLQSPTLDADKRAEYAQTLVSASKRLTNLITNILKLNKLENQQIISEKETFRLDESLTQSTLEIVDAVDEKGIELECDFEEISINSCAAYLEIVWSNLLSNAVKFTERGGRISVSARSAGDRAIVRVEDTGCGISPETGKRIFDKFYQGDTSHSKEGNGLGLALVKKVIDVLGGEISVESEPNKGTAFTVTLKGVVREK